MSRLVLIRHGQTDWNLQSRWQGQADVPLNTAGLAQAEQIANELQDYPLDAIYASDLQRAIQTAEPLAQRKGLAVQIDARLREIHQGEWQGLHIDEIRSRYAAEFAERSQDPFSVAPPGGETALQVQQRVLEGLGDILRANPPQAHIAIVSHGFTLAVILAHFRRTRIEKIWELVPPNGAIIYLDTQVSPASGSPGL